MDHAIAIEAIRRKRKSDKNEPTKAGEQKGLAQLSKLKTASN